MNSVIAFWCFDLTHEDQLEDMSSRTVITLGYFFVCLLLIMT